MRDIPPNSEMTIDYGDKWWAGKLNKFGGQFYCICDWPYCVWPHPHKPQISYSDSRKLAKLMVEKHHRDYLAWKRRQRMVRETMAQYNSGRVAAAEVVEREQQAESLNGEEEMNKGGSMNGYGDSETVGMEE